jgi:hypothetical protein
MRRETLRGSPESVDEGMIDYRRMYFPMCRRLLICLLAPQMEFH